jgi:hypothetical protein
MLPRSVHEVPLPGGTANVGLVVRVGDTVRRPPRSGSAATHALLRYLQDSGFDGAPRFLGLDDRGREILSYVEGAAPIQPYPQWALTDRALIGVAELLRSYHDVVSGFDPSGYRWQVRIPHEFGDPLVSHNDPNLDNVVFRDGAAVALIDFDLACPGSRIWDVATAARLWAPLRADADIADSRRGHALRRLRLFADAYGLASADRALLAEAIVPSHDWIYGIIRHGAHRGHRGFARYWTGDAVARAERSRRWYVEAAPRLRAALR